MRRFGRIMARIGILLLVTVAAVLIIAYAMLQKFAEYDTAKNLLVTTVLETGQLKFVASLVCSDEEIQEIVAANSLKDMDTTQDKSLITIGGGDKANASEKESASGDDAIVKEEVFDENGIRIEEISGRSFYAKMMIIKDPSQVKVGSVYPWGVSGEELDKLVSRVGAVAGVNGGLYVSVNSSGGTPLGVVVQDGEITYNSPWDVNGLYLIGFNRDNFLVIKDIDGMSNTDVENYVATEGIRDAIAFQDEATDANNHFVPLIINGEPRQLGGMGSGANPRTAVGQRADGAVLLLVTDGRGASGHLGATAADLIGIMQDYGAVNAANIDGGSSSSMVYNNAFEMTSVTFYYQNASWKLPTAFVVMPANR